MKRFVPSVHGGEAVQAPADTRARFMDAAVKQDWANHAIKRLSELLHLARDIITDERGFRSSCGEGLGLEGAGWGGLMGIACV